MSCRTESDRKPGKQKTAQKGAKKHTRSNGLPATGLVFQSVLHPLALRHTNSISVLGHLQTLRENGLISASSGFPRATLPGSSLVCLLTKVMSESQAVVWEGKGQNIDLLLVVRGEQFENPILLFAFCLLCFPRRKLLRKCIESLEVCAMRMWF